MPHFVLIGHDGPNGLELRKLHRERHLANLRPLAAAHRVVYGGPILDEAGDPRGSIVVFEAPDLDSARSFAAGDPYVTEGIFERYDVYETRMVLP
ncbi:MAG: YciI family protein [Myxococcota bacterium]